MLKFVLKFILPSIFLINLTSIKAQYFGNDSNFVKSKYVKFDFDYTSLYLKSLESKKFKFKLDLGVYGIFQLDLQPSNLLLKNSKLSLFNGKKHILFRSLRENQWKGIIIGSKRIVRLNIYPNCLNGLIESDSGMLILESLNINGVSKLIVYMPKDNNYRFSHYCNVESNNSNIVEPISPKRNLIYSGYNCGIVKVSNVASYNLFKENKYDTVLVFNLIRDVFNIVDGVYSRDIKIRLKISNETISLDSNSIMNKSLSTLDRIDDFNSKRLSFYGNIKADIVHLYCEKYVPTDNTIGRGYLNGICSKSLNSSCSQISSLILTSAFTVAHEIGHNLGADHKHGSNCATNASIMCTTNGFVNLYFSQSEIDVITATINSIYGKTNNSIQEYCLEYPINNLIGNFDAFESDSVLIELVVDKDFNASKIRNPYGSYIDVSGKSELWLKSSGQHSLIVEIDTNSGLVCNMESDFYIAKGDFVVRNNNSSGIGSIAYAIMNSNVHKGMDTIVFDLPFKENVIIVDSVLPPLVDSCVIDGASQKGFKFANDSSVYNPTVTFLDSLPLYMTYEKYCFYMAKERYEIKNLNFDGFNSPIYSWWNSTFTFKNKYKNFYTEFLDSNFLSEYIIQGNKFENYISAIYLNSFSINQSTDRILIGGDSFHLGNFFIGKTGNSGRIVYSKSLTLKNNYIGIEPGVKDLNDIDDGFSFFEINNLNVINNYFGKIKNCALIVSASTGRVESNSFGYNPFNNEVIYLSGSMLEIIGDKLDGRLIIGDSLNRKENIYFGRKNKEIIKVAAQNGVNINFNKIITNDSNYIKVSSQFGIKPIKKLELDSINIMCEPNKKSIVYGKLKPTLLNDTVRLDFYSVPSYSKLNKVCPLKFLGSKLLFCKDTFQVNFSHTLNEIASNEGIIATATSKTLEFTGDNSNVVFSKANIISPFQFKSDSNVCPLDKFKLVYDSTKYRLKLNGENIDFGYEIHNSGYYEICVENILGCKINHSLILNFKTNYLKNYSIIGPEYYFRDSMTNFKIEPNINNQHWSYFNWIADSSIFFDIQKQNIRLKLYGYKTDLKYLIIDKNGCSNFIEKTIFSNNLVKNFHVTSDSILKIYPNPVTNSKLYFSERIYGKLLIYDEDGRLIFENIPDINGISSLNLNSILVGVYFLYIEGLGLYKLIVE